MLTTSSCPGALFVKGLAKYLNSPPYDPERAFALLQQFQPQNVTGMTSLVDGSVVLHIKRGAHPRPITLDAAYCLPIFAGLALGGSLMFNRRDGRNVEKSRSYLKTSPSDRTVAAIVLDLDGHSFECARPRNGDQYDLHRANLKRDQARRSTTTSPRRDFEMGALRLFDRHAPADIGFSRETYFHVIGWAFEMADFEHPVPRFIEGEA